MNVDNKYYIGTCKTMSFIRITKLQIYVDNICWIGSNEIKDIIL